MKNRMIIGVLLFIVLSAMVYLPLHAERRPIPWTEIFSLIENVRKEANIKRPALILGILETETKFTSNLGSNMGSKEGNIKRCVAMCQWDICKQSGCWYCDDLKKRKNYCTDQQNTLEIICEEAEGLAKSALQVPIAADYGMGPAQFQPTTWVQYPQLKNKNPWKLKDALLAVSYLLNHYEVNSNEAYALSRYNKRWDYPNVVMEKAKNWEIFFEDILKNSDCKSSTDYSCLFALLQNNAENCSNKAYAKDSYAKDFRDCIKSEIEKHTFYQPQPVLLSPLEITPEKDKYQVGNTLVAKFTITNNGNAPITFDKLTVGGRLDDKCPNNECPDFTFRKTTLKPNQSYQYTGSLKLTRAGNYHFFVAYFIHDPTPAEKKLLDLDNWNTSVSLEEGLQDKDRIRDIIVDYQLFKKPTQGKIAFSSYRNMFWDIYLMDADGSNVIQLTQHDYAYASQPTWSPDGRRIAFTSDRDRDGVVDFDIYLMDADGSNVIQLTNNDYNDSIPTWSPDGRRIAFDSNRDGDGDFDIYLMDADGSNVIQLTNNDYNDSCPAWSPDGGHIAFVSNRDGNYEIYLMGADGSNVVQLTHNDCWNDVPAWSPDGEHIAFVSSGDIHPEIYMMDADGSNVIQLTHNGANEIQEASMSASRPSWSPDGERIAFVSEYMGNLMIYLIHNDGSNEVQLSEDLSYGGYTNDMYPAWSPICQ